MTGNFQKSLEKGQIGEKLVAQYLISKGWHVLPAREVTPGRYKGPTLYTSDGRELVTPDMLAFHEETKKQFWVEVKDKTTFSYFWNEDKFTTGMNRNHFDDYWEIYKLTGISIYFMFIHRGGETKQGAPKPPPTGLYGAPITRLASRLRNKTDESINTFAEKENMHYWPEEAFDKLYTLEEFDNTNNTNNMENFNVQIYM